MVIANKTEHILFYWPLLSQYLIKKQKQDINILLLGESHHLSVCIMNLDLLSL